MMKAGDLAKVASLLQQYNTVAGEKLLDIDRVGGNINVKIKAELIPEKDHTAFFTVLEQLVWQHASMRKKAIIDELNNLGVTV